MKMVHNIISWQKKIVKWTHLQNCEDEYIPVDLGSLDRNIVTPAKKWMSMMIWTSRISEDLQKNEFHGSSFYSLWYRDLDPPAPMRGAKSVDRSQLCHHGRHGPVVKTAHLQQWHRPCLGDLGRVIVFGVELVWKWWNSDRTCPKCINHVPQ